MVSEIVLFSIQLKKQNMFDCSVLPHLSAKTVLSKP